MSEGTEKRSSTLFAWVRQFAAVWGFALFLLFVVLLFRAVILPFVLGVLVAYILAPIIRRLSSRRFPRWTAIIVCYVGIAGAIVLLNKFPYNPGHAMVAPHAHKPSLEDLDDAQTADLMRAVRRTVVVLRQVLNPEGFNIGLNIGRAAGAGIPDHIHFHVVPRWNGDTNFMPVIDDVKVIPEALQQTAEKLRPAFAAT